ADKPLPMLEVGVVLGLSDPAKFVQAMSEYRKLFNETWAKGKELAPPGSNVPDFELPAPRSEKREAGTLYFYPLPAQIPLDEQFLPAGGVSEKNKVAALTLSKAHTERLLERTPLKIEGGPLADAKRPLTGALVFNWAGVVDLASPWVDWAVKEKLGDDQ